MRALSKLTSLSPSIRSEQKTAADDIEKLIQKLQLVKIISELMQALSNRIKSFTLFEEQKRPPQPALGAPGRPPRVKIK